MTGKGVIGHMDEPLLLHLRQYQRHQVGALAKNGMRAWNETFISVPPQR